MKLPFQTKPPEIKTNVSFKGLPKNVQKAIIETVKWRQEQSLKKLKELVTRHNREMKSLEEKLKETSKQLVCTHEIVEYTKNGFMSDNAVECKKCGFHWSDY